MRDSYVYSAGYLKYDDNKTINIITIAICIDFYIDFIIAKKKKS